jgi:hypothetical protein
VEFDGSVLRARETSPSKNSDRKPKVAAEFLAHQVCGGLRAAKERMQALIDRRVFINALSSIRVIVAFLPLYKRQMVWTVAIHLVGARETEWRFRAKMAGSHEHVHGADGVYVKVQIWNRGRLVMRRLRGSMNNEAGTLLLDQVPDVLTIADVNRVMPEARNGRLERLGVRNGRAAFSKESLPHVVVDADNFPVLFSEQANTFRAD